MEQKRTKKLYLIGMFANLVLTIIGFFVLNHFSMEKRIELLIGPNIFYQWCYGVTFIARYPFRFYSKLNRFNSFSEFGAKAFSLFFIIGGILLSLAMILTGLLSHEQDRFFQLFSFIMPIGLSIGGLGFKNYITSLFPPRHS